MTRPLIICAALVVARALPAQTQFLPGIAATAEAGEAFGTFSPDGREFIFTIHPGDFSKHRMVITRSENGSWSRPATLPFSGTFNDREPKLSPDGRRLYFSSNRPRTPGDTARRRDLDLWFVDRAADGTWGAPRPVDGVNTDALEFSPSVSANGTLYFIMSTGTGAQRSFNVWRSRPVDLAAGKFAAPEKLGPEINAGFETNVYVTPDESLMLVSRDGAPDSFGGDDLYAARGSKGVWQPMRHLSKPINSTEYEYGPLVSPDGRTLIFTSHRTGKGDIYSIPIGEIDRGLNQRAPR